jgi:L-ascorbate metabolism protein UlaG (beta-lactamase superfamily)
MPRRSWKRAAVLVLSVGWGLSALAQPPVLRAVQLAGAVANAGTEPTPASFVLTSPQGVKVFLDVTQVPDDLRPALDDPRNVFIGTHDHPDHLNLSLLNRFPGARLRGGGSPAKEPGGVVWTAESGDVKVQVLASSHLDDELDGTTNVIVVVDVAGVRVVHMGDCGQTRLGAEQRRVIGKPDVMIQLFEDVLNSEADVANQKAYGLLDQAAPRIVIPTHISSAPAVKLLGAHGYPPDVAAHDELPLSPALLSRKRAVFTGVNRAVAEKAGVKPSGEL